MSNEKSKPKTHISRSSATEIFVREKNLVEELIGKLTFTEMILFHLTGTIPTHAQTTVLDAVLVTLMEHGLTPSAIATRLIYHSAPEALQAAVAAGIMGAGSTYLGTMEGCAALINEMLNAPEGVSDRAKAIVARLRATRQPIHGLGHPFHRPDDPRAPKLFSIAKGVGVEGKHIEALQILSREADQALGRHLTINATGATAAVLGEIGLPIQVLRGVAVICRAAGLVGHIWEEIQEPAARFIWDTVEANVQYEPVRKEGI